MLKRIYDLNDIIRAGKVLIIYGPRQVGKTTLIKNFLEGTKLSYRFDTGDNLELARNISACTYDSTDNHVGNYQMIIIDEAQKIPNIGNALKLMADRHPDRIFIATGSSAFELANQTDESLTGRKKVIKLFPISQLELSSKMAKSELKTKLEEYLIYGSYPEVITSALNVEKRDIIENISNSYLIKDILEFDRIKRSDVIIKLLKLLAFQIGSQVSAHELGRQLGIDVKTTLYYLDLLQKSFVIFPLSGFSRNLRNEVSKMSKYFFYDLGVRNALIANFNKFDERNDQGQLFENFMLIERLKRNEYLKHSANSYFWRTYSQKEIDLIEERDGKLFGYEFKWRNEQVKAPKDWTDNYPGSSYEVINRENYLDFIT